jgi:hypothetical protein
MDKDEMDRIAHLWRSIGEISALANPDGFIATRLRQSAEQRISQIWEILQTIQP